MSCPVHTAWKVHFHKNKKIKSLLSKHVQIMNLILALELLWKAERWYKKYKTCQFCTKSKFQNNGSQKIQISFSSHHSKHFNVGSTLYSGWYNVAMSHNVKSTLKQRCVLRRWNLQRWTTLKQHFVFFNVKLNNVRPTSKQVVIFNVNFHNVGHRQNKIANMTI